MPRVWWAPLRRAPLIRSTGGSSTAVRFGPLSGGTGATLFSDSSFTTGEAIDVVGGKIYWADQNSASIDTAAGKIYWADQTGQVRVGNLDGSGTAQTLFDGEGDTSGVAVDPSAGKVYWGTQAAIRVGNTDGTGAQTLFSEGTNPVSPVLLRAPVGAGAPTISGSSVPGGTLTCSQGSWAPDLVGAFLYRVPRSFSYSWQLNGTPITATTSTITASSAGSYTCIVTGTNQAASANQTSAPFTVSPSNACQDQTGAYDQGFNSGFDSGFGRGFKAGYHSGFQRGFAAGSGSHSIAATPTYPACNAQFDQGFQTAFDKGFNRGFKSGFKPGFKAGFKAGVKAKHHKHG